MNVTKVFLLGVCVFASLAASCENEPATPAGGRAGNGGSAVGGTGAGTGGASPAGNHFGGAAGGGVAGAESKGGTGGQSHAGDSSSGGTGDGVPAECGDPKQDGVLVYQDVTEDTTWACPVYTLTQPIYVRSAGTSQTVLHVEPGVTIRGIKGVEPIKLPGALIITRTGRIDAVGTRERPITFTTAEPRSDWAPGAWGGLVLLGRAEVNAPSNFEASGLPAGEVYAEALPRSEQGIYGSPRSGAGGAGGEGGSAPLADYSDWNCGTVKYARVDFAGFKAGSTKELNGITLGGCGSQTIIDHVQVHRCSDDGIEVFGGAPRLSHLVLTGNQDDQFDWDQGFRGKVQFMAIQVHDDADGADSCGIEADGYATPEAPYGLPSAPQVWNVTMIASKVTQRGLRMRDGTHGFIGNAILAAHSEGAPKGLVDIDHPLTADALGAGSLAVKHSILRGTWPAAGQADSQGKLYLEQDFFTGAGPGATGNDIIGALSELGLVDAFNLAAPQWVPNGASTAAQGGAVPGDPDDSGFFDETATYRGAFVPGGEDWSAGWTHYP